MRPLSRSAVSAPTGARQCAAVARPGARRAPGPRGAAPGAAAAAAAAAPGPRAPRPGAAPQRARGSALVARATLDDPELREMVWKLVRETPDPPSSRPKLEAVLTRIDEINAGDPKSVPDDSGRPAPLRLAYSKWLTKWVSKLDPKASDELLILARGKSVESWKLSAIRRDDYAPNTGGQRMWEFDRKRWMADRLVGIMKDAGYDEGALKLVEDVMMGRDIPNPRDMRPHDLVGPFGLVNLKLLAACRLVQTLADAEALVFLERSFEDMLDRMPADEVEPLVRKELANLSQAGTVAALKMKKWSPVQEKLLAKALPKPERFNDVLRNVEGVAASSTHPGDHRYLNFDYE